MTPEIFWYFCALRRLLVQSKEKISIELLNIHRYTDLVLMWLTYGGGGGSSLPLGPAFIEVSD